MTAGTDQRNVFSLTPADLITTDVEVVFGTDRLLPGWSDIPQAFKDGNAYTALIEDLTLDRALRPQELTFRPGFEQSSYDLNRCVRAHIASFGSKFEHKIAGLGYLVSKVFEGYPIFVIDLPVFRFGVHCT